LLLDAQLTCRATRVLDDRLELKLGLNVSGVLAVLAAPWALTKVRVSHAERQLVFALAVLIALSVMFNIFLAWTGHELIDVGPGVSPCPKH